MENKKQCSKKAEYVVGWANKMYNYCGEHANQLCTIGEAMGSPCQAKPILEDVQCQQFVESNEGK